MCKLLLRFGILLAVLGLSSFLPATVGAQCPIYVTQWGSTGNGDGQFNAARGVATDAAGNVYVADTENHRIQKFTGTGTYLTQWGSFGSGDGQFDSPAAVATDAAGDVYVADLNNHRIQKFTSTGAYLTQLGSPGNGDGQFAGPWGVATDTAGDVYVADFDNNRIQKFTATGIYLTQWGASGSGNGEFNQPNGVATDATGDVYVADSNNRIQKFTSTGTYLTQWGSTGSGNGQFIGPAGVATDATGDVYVVDEGNGRIQKFTGTGAYLCQRGSLGPGDGQMDSPYGVATDTAGNIFIADVGNSRIQHFGPNSVQATMAPAPSLSEGNGGPTAFDFTVNLSGPAPSEVTINYQTSDGTATVADNDYQLATGSIIIAATDSSGIITVNVVGDTQFEPSEAFDVTITSVTGGATLGSPASATGTILNDDAETNCSGCMYVAQWGSYGTGDGQFNFPGGVATDATGNLYVADLLNSRIQKFTGAGTYLTQWGSYGSGNGEFIRGYRIATDASGDVYVADYNVDRIQKFSSTGTYLTQWGSTGSGNGQFDSPQGVATDAAGNVYVADGGNNHRIQKFTGTGTYLTQWGSLGTGNGQFNRPYGVATDAAGNVYVSEFYGNRIQKFTGTGTYLTQWGSYGNGDGQFSSPSAVAADAAGNVYVTDRYNHRIQKFTNAGTYLCQWGSSGNGDGQFDEPDDVAMDSFGNIFVADYENHRIQKFRCTDATLTPGPSLSEGNGGPTSFNFTVNLSSPALTAVTVNYETSDGTATVADNDYQPATGSIIIAATDSSGIITVSVVGDTQFEPDETFSVTITSVTGGATLGSPANATGTILNDDSETNCSGCMYVAQWGSYGTGDGQFNFPGGVATDATGNLYVADLLNSRIQKFTGEGTYLTQWGSYGSGNGEFIRGYRIATDASGDVYVADYNVDRIQKFSSTGTYLTQWGSTGSGNGQFDSPQGVATDAAGNVYVADGGNNHRIQKFTGTGTYLTQWGSLGTGNGQFNRPYGVATDAAGNVYVSEFYGNRIQKFTGTGTYLTQWGSYGNGDGQFSSPSAVAADAAGNVYVTDRYNHRIQKFTNAGTYLCQWGSSGNGDGQFDEPDDVAMDSFGNIFVADYENHRIQKFRCTDATLTPGPSLSEGNGGPTSFNFTVNLSSPALTAVTVNYETSDGTATVADNDYQPATGSIIIAATDSSGIITINVVGDTQFEPDETFSVTITSVTGGATLGSPANATGTIVNDDCNPPVITVQPPPVVTATIGQSVVTITAGAFGIPTPALQWFLGSTPLADGSHYSGTTGPTLTISSAVTGDAGYYHVEASNYCGAAASAFCQLKVAGCGSRPAITQQPVGGSVSYGQPVTFTVAATGCVTPTYQWHKSTPPGEPYVLIAGATSASHQIPSVAPGDRGYYRCQVTAGGLSSLSSSASLNAAFLFVTSASFTTTCLNHTITWTSNVPATGTATSAAGLSGCYAPTNSAGPTNLGTSGSLTLDRLGSNSLSYRLTLEQPPNIGFSYCNRVGFPQINGPYPRGTALPYPYYIQRIVPNDAVRIGVRILNDACGPMGGPVRITYARLGSAFPKDVSLPKTIATGLTYGQAATLTPDLVFARSEIGAAPGDTVILYCNVSFFIGATMYGWGFSARVTLPPLP